MADSKPSCKHLVLDAGPLLSLSPLRGLAETFYTVPQVLDELKDRRAREHFEQLGLAAGVSVKVQSPDPQSLSHVIQFAKKTGDYSVLSTADMCVIALTYALEQKEKLEAQKAQELAQSESNQDSSSSSAHDDKNAEASPEEPHTAVEPTSQESTEEPSSVDSVADTARGADVEVDTEHPPESVVSEDDNVPEEKEKEREPLDVQLEHIPEAGPSSSEVQTADASSPSTASPPPKAEPNAPLYDDPSDEDDGEGEWITPSNVALHKSRALQLIPGEDAKAAKGKRRQQIPAGCMTADFAMQNVLLQMSLSLVGVEGKKIERVKTWVLRCHACFKICKDSSRKFCPSCGNPTLIRASVTLSAPSANASTPTMQVHLKKNFQYKTRGTIFSIPAPKAGSAKTGNGEGLILREDQTAWVRAKKQADGKREKEERRMLTGAANRKGDGAGTVLSSWMDPDWVPEMLSVGTGGKGRSMRHGGMDGDMPVIGYGKKNPNERRRKK